jgi:hypothetical protein
MYISVYWREIRGILSPGFTQNQKRRGIYNRLPAILGFVVGL